MRAALESIAYQIRDVLEMMHAEAGVAPQVLYADGGPTRNEFLMQFTADITGVELEVAEVAESSRAGRCDGRRCSDLGVVDSLADLADPAAATANVIDRQMDPAKASINFMPAGSKP